MTNSNSIRTGADRNTGIKAFIFGVAASLAFTLVLTSADKTDTAQAPQIVKLERVVITGKRMVATEGNTQVAEIKQLPRVVIEGRRVDGGVQLASATRCDSETRC